jgi:hypothetical protein
MEFATESDAFDEIEGYRTFEKLMRRYRSGRAIYRDVASSGVVATSSDADRYIDIHGWREYAEDWVNRSIIDQIAEMGS